MKSKLISLLFPSLLILLATGCEEEVLTPATESALETYYPLELNRPAYYRVDSIVLTPTVSGIRYDTARVEARETLVETFVGADGALVFRGERWERADESQNFTFKQTFTVTRTATAVVRSEDNLSFTKLVLPLRDGVRWDGHTAFDASRDVAVGPEFLDVYNGWAYRYTNTGEQLTLPTGLQLDSVVTVDQAAIDNLIDLRSAYERYAPGRGLVERFLDARHTQCRECCNGDTASCIDLPWDEKAEKGIIIHQLLLRRE
ncbi:hypothetical protein GGR26_000674 [Lewinella marina]|uniref:Lipoprotein n=1 Tax=Neolewinella marina TaxID=438751 RepID=A0A2G0CIY7_9BACT|nr:hypothetical protein [Neolewinella marina]NJB84929.1 hypothetical protein [Neolewinella marina]PHK99918.1 hypothetical protein CGL56_02410 [Neolewinella marina]